MKLFGLGFIFLLAVISASDGFAQNHRDHADSLSHKERKKQRHKEFRKTQDRYYFKVAGVYARLDTEVSFEFADGLLAAKLGLEDNLGLPDKRTFVTGSFIHRFTPASGLYAQYYGINRKETYRTNKDIIFQQDTIPSGSTTTAYFNTHVVSAGYMLTLKQDPNAFLGAYFNIFVLGLETGVKSEIGSIDARVSYAAPLPNFGMVGIFKLRKWLDLDANIGFFTIKLSDFDGTLFDFSARLVFKPLKWLGISVNYQVFDIRVNFPFEHINTTVDYNFRGPALGLNIRF